MMDQTDGDDRASPIGDTAITGKDQIEDDFQEAGNHVDIRPRLEEAKSSNELALARKHNAALPIHSLPAEIFLQVIQHHMLEMHPNSYREGYNKHLLSLSGVCSYWYNLIRDSPPLWTTLDLSDSPKVVEIVLQRSSSHLLDLQWDPVDLPDQLQPEASVSFQLPVAAIQPHGDRLRSIYISVPYRWIECAIAVLREPAPSLDKLYFIDEDTIACTREFDLFGGIAPQLTNLTLNGISIRWDSEVLYDLTSLSLSWIRFSSTDAILQALSHSPRLQRLEIERCSTGSLATPSSPSVQLSQLVSLDVELGGKAATNNFLDHIISNAKKSP
ncbi:hypothetical protein FRC01_003175 [Tulasnella sp. 417]|nr:hypothetical protein FRC01_003175 [Tulasnella sp. 417]